MTFLTIKPLCVVKNENECGGRTDELLVNWVEKMLRLCLVDNTGVPTSLHIIVYVLSKLFSDPDNIIWLDILI